MSEPIKLSVALGSMPLLDALDTGMAQIDAALAQLRTQEDARLLEVFGSVENVIAASKIYEVVYEPFEFKDWGDTSTDTVTLSRKMWFRKRENI